MRIAIGSDHGGYALKGTLITYLESAGHELVDVGTHSLDSVDYPDLARAVAEQVSTNQVDRGVLCCGTGQGMAITANKTPGVRAAVVSDCFSARMAMEHNDARVLCLGQRVVGEALALECLQSWLDAQFQGDRHLRRVHAIEQI